MGIYVYCSNVVIYSTVMCIQYNIVFVMKLVILYVLFVLLCTLMYSVYDMTDTVLGNAGLNAKPIHRYDFIKLKDTIKSYR